MHTLSVKKFGTTYEEEEPMDKEINKKIDELLNESDEYARDVSTQHCIIPEPDSDGYIASLVRYQAADGKVVWEYLDLPDQYDSQPVPDPISTLSTAIEKMKGWVQDAERLLQIAEEDDDVPRRGF